MHERDKFTCVYCKQPVIIIKMKKGVSMPPNMATLDHIYPKSKGGKYIISNLVTCCARCNNLLADKFDNFKDKRNYIQKVLNRDIEVNHPLHAVSLWEQEQWKKDRVRTLRK